MILGIKDLIEIAQSFSKRKEKMLFIYYRRTFEFYHLEIKYATKHFFAVEDMETVLFLKLLDFSPVSEIEENSSFDDFLQEVKGLEGVIQNGLFIRHIKNPSEHIQNLAIRQNGFAIQFIKNPSEELQRLAIEENAHALEFITDPAEQLQRLAIKQDGCTIQFIENPSEEIQQIAVKQNGLAIQFIENPSDEVKKLAVGQNKSSTRFIGR